MLTQKLPEFLYLNLITTQKAPEKPCHHLTQFYPPNFKKNKTRKRLSLPLNMQALALLPFRI